KGFVGGTIDAATGLTHLGAREYDASTGRFISVDPLMDTNDPQTLNGYAYASNSPVTFADPDGKMVCPGDNLPCYDSGGGKGTDALDDYVDTDGCGGCTTDSDVIFYEPMGTGMVSGTAEDLDRAQKAVLKREPRIFEFFDPRNPCRMGVDAGCNKIPWDNAAQALIFQIMCKQEGITCEGKQNLGQQVMDAAGWVATMEGRLSSRLAGSLVKGEAKSLAKEEAGGCLHSFTVGTDVELADGQNRRIEDVQVGDRVLATNPESGRTESRPVVATIITEHDKDFTDFTVKTASGEASIIATDTHPFWVLNEGRWVNAGDLKPGAELRTDSGAPASVMAVRHFSKKQRTYDLTVDGIHTYYVLAGSIPVLVHNCTVAPGVHHVPTPQEAQEIIQNAPRGSSAAKKSDPYHRAPIFVQDEIAEKGKVWRQAQRDPMNPDTMLHVSVPGEVNGRSGNFHWVVDPRGTLVHEAFEPR
ncbi:polymorphic toxin-type HINT domain-containing protein, partial [Streptomyces sp. NPDC049577]|uniref:polymorphic toxin-type HINT domain-containing protein n=1 Tax=Streptomyces sp. NPDC049577 TaxID=3155153 RepID=UPI003418281A